MEGKGQDNNICYLFWRYVYKTLNYAVVLGTGGRDDLKLAKAWLSLWKIFKDQVVYVITHSCHAKNSQK